MSIESVRKKYSLNDVTKLASNENLWGTSASAAEALKKELGNLHVYPESEPAALISELAKGAGVSEECVMAGNGTDEIIELVAKTFLSQDDNIVVSENSFIRYKMAGQLMGAGIIEVPMRELKIDLEGIASGADGKTKIIYIDNPCNPVGSYSPAPEIERFLKKLESQGHYPLVVIDEAYFDYASAPDYSSSVVFMNQEVPVMVLRTFSKIYGLAGLRIGYAVSLPGVISLINRIRPPFNTNRLAQAAALAVLRDSDFVNMVKKETEKEKQYLYAQMDKLGLEYVRSQANFILVKFGRDKVGGLCEYLLSRGIILRSLAGYSLDDYIRITVGKREHNEKLVGHINSFYNRKEKI